MTKGGKGKPKARHTRTSKKGKVFEAGKGVKIYTPKLGLIQRVRREISSPHLLDNFYWKEPEDRIVEYGGQKYTLKDFGDGRIWIFYGTNNFKINRKNLMESADNLNLAIKAIKRDAKQRKERRRYK